MSTLWNLRLDNPLAVSLALVPAVLNMAMLVYILLRMPDRSVVRAFSLFVLGLLCWQVDDVMARMALSRETASLWDHILGIGWLMVGPVGVYFALIYTGQRKLANNPLVLAALFLPALVFSTAFRLDLFPHAYIYIEFWGWSDQHNAHPFDYLLVNWIGLLVILMLLIMARYSWRVRHQSWRYYPALVITLGLLIPTVQGIVTQIIMPLVFHYPAIPVTSTFLSFFTIATFIAFSKFHLFSPTEQLEPEVLLSNLSDLVLTISPDGRVMYMNPAAAEVLGWDENMPEEHWLAQLFSQKEGSDFQHELLDMANQNKRLQGVEKSIRTAKGTHIPVLLSADPILSRGRLAGILITLRDISAIKAAEKHIREQNEALARSNSELEQYAYVASHDLKEPLRMVMSYTQLLAKRYGDKLDEDALDYIAFATEGVNRMHHLIDDLLQYSHIRPEEMEFETVDTQQVLDEVVHVLTHAIAESGGKVVADPLPKVRGSRTQLMRLFQNLITNALKFRGNNLPVVRVTATPEGNMWHFQVKDNGIGIAPEYQQKIFGLFQRLHTRDKYDGSGIGLTVSRKIVELHGGRIWVESKVGEGTTFHFTLPVV